AVDGTLRSAQDLIPSLTAAYDDYVAKRDGLLAALGTFETSPTPSAKQRFQIALASFNDAADRCSASVDAILGQLTSAATTAASYASLLVAQSTLDGATLRAPAAGTVLSIGAELGENVSAAFIVLDAATLQLRGTVGEADVARLGVGQPATVRVEALGGSILRGTVTAIDSGATRASIALYGVAVTIAAPSPAL